MILIAIGSNLNSDLFGTPRKNCEAALSVMKNYFEILNISNFYKTEPIPKSSQPWFVNSVVNVRCEINPEKVLEILLRIENYFGRKRTVKNEARVIDLDLISYNDLIINTEKLILPHPRMHLRKFVIKPICDIDETWIHPVFKKKAYTILKELAKHDISTIN